MTHASTFGGMRFFKKPNYRDIGFLRSMFAANKRGYLSVKNYIKLYFKKKFLLTTTYLKHYRFVRKLLLKPVYKFLFIKKFKTLRVLRMLDFYYLTYAKVLREPFSSAKFLNFSKKNLITNCIAISINSYSVFQSKRYKSRETNFKDFFRKDERARYIDSYI